MPKYVHIVQVHPVENGVINLSKINTEHEFDNMDAVNTFILDCNEYLNSAKVKAVYFGQVNDLTGELE